MDEVAFMNLRFKYDEALRQAETPNASEEDKVALMKCCREFK